MKMPTNRDIVSKVINAFKLNNRDDHGSRRFILRVLQDTTIQLLSQKWLDRTILSEMNLYTFLPCFEFKKIDIKECSNVEFRMCNTLMKSKKPLPRLVFSRLGASVKEIVSLDGNYRFVFIDKGQYQRNKKRQYSINDEVYVYLDSDNHLYIPDEEIWSLDLTILTPTPEEVDECSSCTDNKCKSKWDAQFIVSDKLLDVVFNQTLQVLGLSRQIREDQNPNNVSGS